MNQPPPAGGYGAPQPYPQGSYPPPQAMPPKKKMSGCMIALIVLALMVPVLGVMSVLAISGVRKYIANAKTAEARNTLGQIAKSAATAYERDGKLCPSATPVPVDISSVRGRKYMSAPGEWEDKSSGWSCLGFSMMTPQYFQYAYTSTGSSFTATAHGDLNGDGEVSTFQVTGMVEGNRLVIAPTIAETNPEE